MMGFRGSGRGQPRGQRGMKRGGRGGMGPGGPMGYQSAADYWSAGDYDASFATDDPHTGFGSGGYPDSFRGDGGNRGMQRGRGQRGAPFRAPFRGGPMRGGPPMPNRPPRFPRGGMGFGPMRGPRPPMGPFPPRGHPYMPRRPFGRGIKRGTAITKKHSVSATHFDPPKDGTIITAKFEDGFPCYHEAISKILEHAPVVKNCAGNLTIQTTPENMKESIVAFREKFDGKNELTYQVTAPRRADTLCKYVYIKEKIEDSDLDKFCQDMAKVLEAVEMEPIKKSNGQVAKFSYLLKYDTEEKAALCQQKTYAFKDQTLYIRPYFKFIGQEPQTTTETSQEAADESK